MHGAARTSAAGSCRRSVLLAPGTFSLQYMFSSMGGARMHGLARVLAAAVVGPLALVVAPGAARSPTAANGSPLIDEPADETSAEPVELVARRAIGYRKGRPVRLMLVTLGWTEVELETARAFLAMREEAARSGVDLWIRSGYRSREQQAWLYRAWREGWGNRAARPGHSNHESGRALDLHIGDEGTLAWLKANGRRFGFRRTVAGEPWHWEYTRRRRAKSKSSVARRSKRH
jgi:zinc D-Ala-D-Ala carboxypeptidase